MPSVGEELKRERELRGITLKEIADETKIAVRVLEAIESDRLDTIIGEFYRRAGMRAYARYLGIDDDRIVATHQFRSSDGSLETGLSESGAIDWKDRFAELPSRLATKWVALVLVGLALSGAAVAVWPGGGVEAERTAVSPSVVTKQVEKPVAEPVIREELAKELSSEAPLSLLLKVDEQCWLEVQADGALVAQGLMLRGYQTEIQAQEEVRLWLGNAGGISIWVNGNPGLPLGRLGQVRKDVRITPENLSEFIVPEDSSDDISPEPADDIREEATTGPPPIQM